MSDKNDEGYPEDWARVELMVSPSGECHAIGGDREPGEGDMPYPGLERIKEGASKAATALRKIDVIRNSVIAAQKLNWSEHIYPLVAALEEAGIKGMGYPKAKEYFGTMLERTLKAEEEVARLKKAGREKQPEAIYVAHHDDPPCEARLSAERYCKECGFHPDMQSLSLWPYCPACDVPLKKLACPGCGVVYIKPRETEEE